MSLNEIFFKKSERINDVIVFYTNISKISDYKDNGVFHNSHTPVSPHPGQFLPESAENLIEYIDKILEENAENYWKWTIDATNFEIKNIKIINRIIVILDTISKKYSKNLLQIDIINPICNFFNIIYFFGKLFINKELKQKIRFIHYNIDIEENQNLIDF
jgi:hypothetical protein